MRLTAQEIYEHLINNDHILEIEGQIKFYLGDVNIIVKQKDVVGNIIYENVIKEMSCFNGISFLPRNLLTQYKYYNTIHMNR